MARRIEDDPSIITPFPTVPVSSGEWVPQAITDKQRIATKLIAEEMDRQARRHGMTRKQFMRTAAATASAFMILNKVHGRDAWGDNAVLKVKKEHCDDLDAARELLNKDDFVVDVQTHHIDLMPPTLSPAHPSSPHGVAGYQGALIARRAMRGWGIQASAPSVQLSTRM